ncbi:MAG TPA: SusC/RagA family TonB-linked outer membrane protein [Parasegetibacter sp.]
MRITSFILLALCMQVSATTLSQTISLRGEKLSLKTVFSEIEKQTGYVVLYNRNLLSQIKPVTISVENAPLTEFLDKVLKDNSVTYRIEDKTIALFKKSDPVADLPSDIPAQVLPPVRMRVMDSLGNPLAGASITVKNKKTSGVTDAQGYSSINVVAGDVIVISFVGYESRTLRVTAEMLSSGSLDIRMTPSASELEEIQISINTGYQRIRPEHSTGSVAKITSEELNSRVNTDFLSGLANRLPGLMINNDVSFNDNGTSRSLFNIRGISTMTGSKNPLIVIDGYPTELSLNMIDPNEIESVTILKDAAAATVYGVRASNGVIIITRKQAEQGKPKFAFRATAVITPKPNYDRYRWEENTSAVVAEYQRTLASKSITANSWDLLATPTSGTGGATSRHLTYYLLAQQAANMITPAQATKAWADLEGYDNRNDYSRLFQRNAVTQAYNFNVSGGSSNALYYITANYTGNRNTSIKNYDDRLWVSARTNLKLSNRLSLELNTEFQQESLNSAPIPSITGTASWERFQDENGNPGFVYGSGISPWYNNILVSQGLYDQLYYPLVDVNAITDKTRRNNNHITADFRYEILRGLSLSFGGVYEVSNSNLDYYASENSSVARRYVNSYVSRQTDGSLKYNVPRGGYLRQTASSTKTYTARAQLNYNKRINEVHTLNGIIGAEVRNLIEKSNRATYFGYNDESLLHQPIDVAGISTGSVRGAFQLGQPLQDQYNNLFAQGYLEDRFISLYSNIVYSFKSKYTLSASARIDQSNLFGTNPKYKYKPLWSLGAGWNLHNEDFLREVSWIRELRLRGAYGFNGNVAKNSLPELIAAAALNMYTNPVSQTLIVDAYANSSLRWEQTQNLNLGIDYNVFRNVSGTIEYYRKKSTDLMGRSLIDPTIGISPSYINQASIVNQGFEVSLRADWISTKKVNWNTGFVVSRNTSVVTEVYQRGDHNPQTLNALGYVKNYPVGALFAYRWGGLDSAGYSMVMNAKGERFHTNNNSTGSPITDLMKSDTSGFTYFMGSSIPTISAGLSNRVDIGNFYVYAMINYYGGFKVRIPRPNPSSLRPLEGAGTYWRAKGDELVTDVMGLAAYSSANSNNAYNYADKYVVHGDYVTLGDLTLSYNFGYLPFFKRAGFTNFELRAQGSNLLTVGMNRYNYSVAMGGFEKTYITPRFAINIVTNF